MPIEFSHPIAGARPVGAIDTRAVRTAAGAKDPAASAAAPGGGTGGVASVAGAGGIAAGTMLDPGPPPVDAERVAVIRKAIETGSYPVLPTKIADAMIAAGLLLRVRA